MARIFITGSSDGLGSWTAQRLVKQGHRVVLHARNAERAKDALAACPGAETVVTGDLSSFAQTKQLAEQVNKLGTFDAVIHNAGIYKKGGVITEDGIPTMIAVNTMAPYILTCLINKPTKSVVYLSSELHVSGDATLRDVTWEKRGPQDWDDEAGYADTKLHDILFAKAFARKWPDVKSNSMDPGWIPTKMGGPNAPGDAEAAIDTCVMLSLGDGLAGRSGRYFEAGKKEADPINETNDESIQDRLLSICENVTGVKFSDAQSTGLERKSNNSRRS